MKWILALTAAGEAAFGFVLLIYPPIVVRLLFNSQIEGVGMVISRVTGIALIALGLACWPGDAASGLSRPLRAMLFYSLLITFYLTYLGIHDLDCNSRIHGDWLWVHASDSRPGPTSIPAICEPGSRQP